MKIKQKFRKVMAALLSVAMVMTLCVGLDFGTITASAAFYSDTSVIYTTVYPEDGTLLADGDTLATGVTFNRRGGYEYFCFEYDGQSEMYNIYESFYDNTNITIGSGQLIGENGITKTIPTLPDGYVWEYTIDDTNLTYVFTGVTGSTGEEEEENTPTGATYTYSYGYDCQRSPSYPVKGSTVRLYSFSNPLGSSGSQIASNGTWKINSAGLYDPNTHTETVLTSITSVVTNIANTYGVDASEIEVFDLTKDDEHICYGVVSAIIGDGLFFIGTTWTGAGAGYYFCNNELSSNDEITETVTGDATDLIPDEPEEETTTATIENLESMVNLNGSMLTFTVPDDNGEYAYNAIVTPISYLEEAGMDAETACSEAMAVVGQTVADYTAIDMAAVDDNKSDRRLAILNASMDSSYFGDADLSTLGGNEFFVQIWKINPDEVKSQSYDSADANPYMTGISDTAYIYPYYGVYAGVVSYDNGGSDTGLTDTTLLTGYTVEIDDETNTATISNLSAQEGASLYYTYYSQGDLTAENVDSYNEYIDEDINLEYADTSDLGSKITGTSISIPMTGSDPYMAVIFEYFDGTEDANGEVAISRVAYVYLENGNSTEEETYKITLDTTNLKNATAVLENNTYTFEAGNSTNLIITPNEGYAFESAPTAVFDPAEFADYVSAVKSLDDGSYICEISGINNSCTVTITGEAVAAAGGSTGDITNATNPEENDCNADLDLSDADIEDVIELTQDDEQAVANGEDINIILEVENADATVSADDKTATEAALTTNMKVGMYLDISLFKKVGDNDPTEITETNQPITITFVMPDELIENGRIFSIVRVHNGKADILSCDFDAATKKASFETDKFSSYAITYKDSTDDSGNTTPESTTTTPESSVTTAPESSVTTAPESSVTTSPDESSGTNSPVIPNIPVVTGAPTTAPATTTTATTSTTTAPAAEEDVEEDVEEDIEIDDDTDTTKPADDEDDAEDEDVSINEDDTDDTADEDSDVEGDKEETDEDADGNPETGVAVGLAGAIIAAAVVVLSKKRK